MAGVITPSILKRAIVNITDPNGIEQVLKKKRPQRRKLDSSEPNPHTNLSTSDNPPNNEGESLYNLFWYVNTGVWEMIVDGVTIQRREKDAYISASRLFDLARKTNLFERAKYLAGFKGLQEVVSGTPTLQGTWYINYLIVGSH